MSQEHLETNGTFKNHVEVYIEAKCGFLLVFINIVIYSHEAGISH